VRATEVTATLARSAYADQNQPTTVGFELVAAVFNRRMWKPAIT